MHLADPDLPQGVDLPALSARPPEDIDLDRYQRLRDAFEQLPRRSRVVVALRLPRRGHAPLTLNDIGVWLGVGVERIRQLEQRAIWDLSSAWLPDGGKGRSGADRVAELVPVLGVALDRFPIASGAVPRSPILDGEGVFDFAGCRRLGDALRRERKRQGLRQDDLALGAGLDLRAVGEVEAGKATAQLATWLAIIHALGFEIVLVRRS